MLKWAKDSLQRFGFDILDITLSIFIQISSEIILDLNELDIAKKVEDKFIFAISLLGTTIQDGGMKIWILVIANSNKLLDIQSLDASFFS